MCATCDQLTEHGNQVLNQLLDMRRERKPYNGPSRHEMLSATMLLKSVDPEDIRYNPDVQDLCLALAIALERFHTLEKEVTT